MRLNGAVCFLALLGTAASTSVARPLLAARPLLVAAAPEPNSTELEKSRLSLPEVSLTLAPTDEPQEGESNSERFHRHRRRFQGVLEAALPPTLAEDHLEGNEALNTVHGVAKHVVMPGMALLLFVLLATSWLNITPYVTAIPASAWTVFFSAIFGSFVRGLLDAGVITGTKYVWASATFLNLFLLPIIIFESGWTLNHLNFLSQLEYICIFAVVGTLVSFFFVGLAGYYLGQQGIIVITGLREHLVFAALISAVDPVATLSTFSKLGLDHTQPLLHTMIFGESVINDAVAIVLFHTINSSWEQMTVATCTYDIAVLLFGSAGFGVLFSGMLIWFLRVASLPGNTVSETLYVVASAWLTFAAAEGSGLSGIIANLCAGSMFRIYGAKHLARKGKEMTTEFLEVSAHLMDTMVFILCGASTAMVQSLRGVKFAVIAFFLCLVGRALSTSSCAAISNGIKWFNKEPSSQQITVGHQCMMWHAGLRGGIALVLALEIDASWCHHKATIINGTFIIICGTLLLLGSTTEPMLRAWGFQEPEENAGEERAGGPAEEHGLPEEGEGGHGTPQQKKPSLMEEIRSGHGQRLKQAVMTHVHGCLTRVLVGDVQQVQEQHEKKRMFLQSLRVSKLLVPAHRLQSQLHTYLRPGRSSSSAASPDASASLGRASSEPVARHGGEAT